MTLVSNSDPRVAGTIFIKMKPGGAPESGSQRIKLSSNFVDVSSWSYSKVADINSRSRVPSPKPISVWLGDSLPKLL